MDAQAASAAAAFLGEDGLAEAASALVPLAPKSVEAAREAYARRFGFVVSGEWPPFEVEYEERTDVFHRTQALADIAGFYRAFALESLPGERPDHLAVEAEFLRYLLERAVAARRLGHGAEKEGILDDAYRAFFRDHAGAWMGAFAAHLRPGPDDLYAAAAPFLSALVEAERVRLDLPPPAPREPRLVPLPEAPGETSCGAACGM